MKALFGLVGILAVVGVIVWFLGARGGGLDHLKTVSAANKSAKETVSQAAGRDLDTGEPVKTSATLDLVMLGGKKDSVLVTSIKSGGPYEKFWGLKRDDAIIQIGPMAVKDHPLISNTEDADDVLMDAYQKRHDLIVMRDGNRTTLTPVDPSAKPSEPAAKDQLQQQLDSIQERRGN